MLFRVNGTTGTESSETKSDATVAGGESDATTTTTAGGDAKGATTDAKTTTTTAGGEAEKKTDATAKTDATKVDAKPLEVKFPEGWAADNPLVSEFKKVAGELGINDSAKAQQLVDLYVKGTTAATQARAAANAKVFANWRDAAKKDPEFGGAKFDATVVNVRKAVTAYGDPELKGLLNETGLGDHPAIIRLLNKVGLALAEDSTADVKDRNGAGQADPQKALQDALYTHPTSRPSTRG